MAKKPVRLTQETLGYNKKTYSSFTSSRLGGCSPLLHHKRLDLNLPVLMQAILPFLVKKKKKKEKKEKKENSY